MRLRRPQDPGALVVAALVSLVYLGCALGLAFFCYETFVLHAVHV